MGLEKNNNFGANFPDNSIETKLNFLVEMMQHFIDGKKDFDSIINMNETSIFLGFQTIRRCFFIEF